jgi:hypothetical protein
MRKNARLEFAEKFTAARNLKMLLAAYEIAKRNQEADSGLSGSVFLKYKVAGSGNG